MKIVISPRAEKQLEKLPKVKQIIVAEKIRSLGLDNNVWGEEKLAGFQKIFRIRVGDYRIVYRRINGEIYLILIGHRSEIYKLLERLVG